MQICIERIESVYVMPGELKFDHDCLIVLRSSLLALAPKEGCALLVGNQHQSTDFQSKSHWHVRFIWPCSNIWKPGMLNFFEAPNDSDPKSQRLLSQEERFVLDPLEQLKAQRWAREHNFHVLGSAHSHPNGEAVPSLIDRRWNLCPGLMVIVGKTGKVRAWWMPGRTNEAPKEVDFLTTRSKDQSFAPLVNNEK